MVLFHLLSLSNFLWWFLMQLFLFEMATPAKLQIIFGKDDIRKLFLPSGIPSTLQDLTDVITQTFKIIGWLTVMYQDMDFNGQFLTLTSIEEVQDKATVKLVMTELVVLTFLLNIIIIFQTASSVDSISKALKASLHDSWNWLSYHLGHHST